MKIAQRGSGDAKWARQEQKGKWARERDTCWGVGRTWDGGVRGKGMWRDEGQRGTRTWASVVDMFAQDQTAKAMGQRRW